jgi:hypothetical protein
MTAAACERSRVSAAMDEFIRALVSTEICSAAARNDDDSMWNGPHCSLRSACPEDNHCFPFGSIFQHDSAAVVAATASRLHPVFFIFSHSHKKLFQKLKLLRVLLCHKLRSVMYGILHECLTQQFYLMKVIDFFLTSSKIAFQGFLGVQILKCIHLKSWRFDEILY